MEFLRFEWRDGERGKYWEVRRDGSRVEVRYAAIGRAPRHSEKSFETEAEAERHLAKLVREKERKGYVAVSPAAAAEVPSPKQGAEPGGEWAERFGALERELRDNPHVELERWSLAAPRQAAEVQGLLASSPFAGTSAAVELESIYCQLGAVQARWKLVSSPTDEIDPAHVTGEIDLMGIEDIVDNAQYLDLMGDMGSEQAREAMARLYPLEMHEGMYSVVLDAADAGRVRLVADDGTGHPTNVGPAEHLERLLLCRGYHSFAWIAEGRSSGGDAMVAVLESVFGERDVSGRLPKMAKPRKVKTGDGPEHPLCAALQARGVEVRHEKGRKTDPYPHYLVFPDGFADFDTLSAVAGTAFTSLGLSRGDTVYMTESAYLLGVRGAPRGLWEVVDERLRDGLSAQRAETILGAVVEKLGRPDAPYFKADDLRRYANALRDMVTALDPEAAAEVRTLAAESMFDSHPLEVLEEEIAKSGLRKKARERLQSAVRRIAELR